MKKILILSLLCIFIVSAGVAQQSSVLPYNPQLRKGVLDNGLTYYIYPNAYPKGEAVYRLFVKSGSVNETERQRGLAHFLEHMAFNGSQHFPDDKMVSFLEGKGAKFGKDLNAHTSFNETVYKLQLPSSSQGMVDSTLTILSDWGSGLLIDSVQVEKERGVILSEWLSRQSSQQEEEMAFLNELLNNSRYSERITIGDTAVIKHCSPRDIAAYYRTWYHPSLMAIAVVGDVDVDSVEKQIRHKFEFPYAEVVPNAKTYPIPPYKKNLAKSVVHKSAEDIELNMIELLPLPSAVLTEQNYKEYLYRTLINRLLKMRFDALAFDNPSYKKATIQRSSFLNTTGVLLGSVELQPDKITDGIQNFIANKKQVFRYGFTGLEIESAKKRLYTTLANQVNSKQEVASAQVMNDIYSDFFVNNRFISPKYELNLLKRYLPTIDSLSLVKVLQKDYDGGKIHYLLSGDNRIYKEVESDSKLMKIIQQAEKEKVPRYYKEIALFEKLGEAPRSGEIIKEQNLPEIGATSLWLNNGTRVIFKSSQLDKDRIVFTGFRRGGLYSLDSLEYYSGLLAPNIVSLSGAGSFSREELNYFLSGNSASMRFLVDKTRTGIAGSSQKKDMETLFQLLYTKWTAPRLDTLIYDQVISKMKDEYRTKIKTPEEVFQRELSWLLSGRNYTNGELTDSILSDVVEQKDMLPLFNKFFGKAAGYTFVLIGDCSLEEVRGYIKTYIGGLPTGQPDTAYVFRKREIPTETVSLERHTGNSPKAVVSLIFQNAHMPEDFQQFQLKSEILRDLLKTTLRTHLREEMGKVYGVSVKSAAGLYPSFLSRTMISFVCLPKDVDALVDATRMEINHLCKIPMDYADILKNIQNNLLKDFALNKQKNSYWSSLIRNAVYNQSEDWGYVENYDKMLKNITIEEVADFARSLIVDVPMIKAVLYPRKGE
ncbi:MAG: insulinase family protein [Bacteroides sp.]|jgi:predicted Zn-dependent peptidase|nr:insulinase family protein [Bacteroides sp.]